MKPMRFGVLAVLCLFVFACAAGQGLYFETTKSSGGTEKSWYMPGKFKSVDPEGRTTIILIDKETVYDINPESKSYTETTFSDLKKMFEAGHAQLSEAMQKRLESLTPEQRKMVEERMAGMTQGSHAETKYDVTSTGESKTISGYPCSEYIVKRNGEDFETIWATKALGDLPTVHQDMEKLSQKLAAAMNSKSEPLSWFKEIQGFPIQTDQQHSSHTVTLVEKRSVSDSEFEVPSGYTKEEMKMPGKSED